MDIENLSIEELSQIVEEKEAAARAVADLDAPTLAQVEEAEAALDDAATAQTEIDKREAEAQSLADRQAALRTKFSAEDEVEEDEAEAVEVEAAADEVEEAAVEDETEGETEETPVATKAASRVARVSKKVERPKAPAKTPVTITAAADVPNFSNGQNLSMDEVGTALINRMRGFSAPSGDGRSVNLQHYGVAKFKMDFEPELVAHGDRNDMAVLEYAANEQRLTNKSLVAAGGWCAPSETLYDLCVTETLDGILSIAEVNVTRGGINFTKGPDFSTIYSNVGFLQTEAEAIAGTAKDCFEVPCPDFEEERLDAIGLCIKAPILTNSAYPELVRRWLAGSMVAHAHKVNAEVLARMTTLAGTALTVNDFGGTAASTLANLTLIGDRMRQVYKLSQNATLEVAVPFWVKGAIRSDLALRNGGAESAITDAMIQSEFTARNLSVQFVYDWQETSANAVTQGYPETFDALIYPAGTFVKGTSDVISLNAVYDAASLATNIYTALFFEQGLLVANVCNDASLVTIPVCLAGRTGASDVVECGLGAEA
jgi:hypothetical protein